MVLANGQHMFTDSADGRYEMDVPLNSNSEITLHTFCDGFEPFKAVLKSWEAANYDINMSPVTAESNAMTVAVSQTSSAESGKVRLSGKVSNENGTPLCTVVLANGQHVFSCGGDGAYDLEVPLDNYGKITLFVFCEGMQPYKKEWTGAADAVYFPDQNLEAVIRQAINKPTGYIRKSDLQDMTELSASGYEKPDDWQIKNIEGIEYCTSLAELDLSASQISDISALAGLSLTELDLSDNQISDISALAEQTSLTELDLSDNQISDISAVAGLTSLTKLDLSTDEQLPQISEKYKKHPNLQTAFQCHSRASYYPYPLSL